MAEIGKFASDKKVLEKQGIIRRSLARISKKLENEVTSKNFTHLSSLDRIHNATKLSVVSKSFAEAVSYQYESSILKIKDVNARFKNGLPVLLRSTDRGGPAYDYD